MRNDIMGSQQRESKKRIRRRIRGTFSLILILIVFLLWGIYGLLQSDLMNVKVLEVSGNSICSEEEVINVSQMIFNRNIFKYDLKDIKAKVESHPYIKVATVNRKLPNTLIINVKERKEYAIISYMGSFLYVDMEGVVLKISDSYLSNELPLITGLKIESLELGKRIIATEDTGLVNGLRLVEAAKLGDMLDAISEINIKEADNLRLITTDGIEVMLGLSKDPVYQMLSLKEVLVKLYSMEKRDVIIDMRYEHITVKDREIQEESNDG
ncbi:cell division protein FtsQ/DivIB [Alkaliphilus pronyensis]|uniref:cell division protein FtsQ/DivIB n=1 Tax=Alkaliphilus pronyensis TaxID=1482732 RepID=UPI0018657866|nr:FtsQ-type POTRA domain-containing protein [Alkaliphilus pronyensis]